MADLIHSVTARLRKYVGDRRRALRREARFEARLPFTISLLSADDESGDGFPNIPSLSGQTRDISEKGLTLLLPSARIRGVYLTVSDMYLGINLELPTGSVGTITTSVRFEQLSTKEAGFGYLLGVRIIKMQEGEKDRYLEYLGTLESKDRRAPGRRHPRVATALAGQSSTVQMSALETLTPQSVSNSFEKFLRERKP
jgi:hypothetical protein